MARPCALDIGDRKRIGLRDDSSTVHVVDSTAAEGSL